MCVACGCSLDNLYIEGDEHNPHSAFRSAPFAPAARPKMKITGIKAPEFTPSQTEEGDLHYGHGEAGTHAPGMSQRRMLEVEIDVLDKNNRLAERNRALCCPQATGAPPGFQPWFRQNHPADGNPNAPERQRSVRSY